MTLEFRTLRSGRELAFAGVIVVGAVRPIEFSRTHKAQWCACLPDGEAGMPVHEWRMAADLDAARELLGRHVVDWFGATRNLAPADDAHSLARRLARELLRALQATRLARIDIDVIRGACIGAAPGREESYRLEELTTRLLVERVG